MYEIFTFFVGVQALMGRVPSSYAYDAELQLFVADLEEHEAFKRGKATCRQVREHLRYLSS